MPTWRSQIGLSLTGSQSLSASFQNSEMLNSKLFGQIFSPIILEMGYRVIEQVHGYEPRKGLEGPFAFGNGRTLYYDTKEGKYWDPKTDFYLSDEEIADLWDFTVVKLKGK